MDAGPAEAHVTPKTGRILNIDSRQLSVIDYKWWLRATATFTCPVIFLSGAVVPMR